MLDSVMGTEERSDGRGGIIGCGSGGGGGSAASGIGNVSGTRRGGHRRKMSGGKGGSVGGLGSGNSIGSGYGYGYAYAYGYEKKVW